MHGVSVLHNKDPVTDPALLLDFLKDINIYTPSPEAFLSIEMTLKSQREIGKQYKLFKWNTGHLLV